MATRTTLRGRVTAFDDHAGLGEVTTPAGPVHPFHCTAIADGTRTIPVGAEVTFVIVPGRSGMWEAVQLTPR